jgi:hypothetical protein
MITSSYVYSWNGHQPSIEINKIDTLNVGFNIEELDTSLVLIPINNIKNANALYIYQTDRVDDYKELVQKKDSIITNTTLALSYCRIALNSSETMSHNLELKNEEMGIVINKYKNVNRISISVILLLIGGLIVK